ncbi:hypothetical protein BS17DRAFT_777436 [Gyrodon lividus]|nr:hypothetical protein BS17DRAFT_777436 [Gyrodon lividus]
MHAHNLKRLTHTVTPHLFIFGLTHSSLAVPTYLQPHPFVSGPTCSFMVPPKSGPNESKMDPPPQSMDSPPQQQTRHAKNGPVTSKTTLPSQKWT